MRRSKLHHIKVRGVGRLAVSGKLPKVQKTVLVGGKRYPIAEQDFMEAWALSRSTGRSFKELLAERVSVPEPKVKLSPFGKYERDVNLELGRFADAGSLMSLYERGATVEQAVSELRADVRAREEEKRKR
jgi:hypothetical protein